MSKKLQDALEQQKKSTVRNRLRIVGTLGLPIGGVRTVSVPNRNNFVYVKLRDNQNEVIQAFNNMVAPSYGLPVIVERQHGRYTVIGVDTVRYQNNWNSNAPFLPRHGNTHSFDTDNSGGGDIVWVMQRQFMPSLIIPSGSLGGPNVIMSSYTLQNLNGTWKYTGNTGTVNLTPYKPTMPTGTTLILTYLDVITGNPGLLFATGTFVSAFITGTAQLAPYMPAVADPTTQIPLSVIRLVTGTSTIGWDNIYDVRQFLHPVPTGTGGGGGSITGSFDGTYLKLDTSNDPLTGQLQILPMPTGTSALFARSYGNTKVAELSQIGNGVASVTNPILYLYRGSGTSTPEFDSYAVTVEEDTPNTSNVFGGMWRHNLNGNTMLLFNPRMPASGNAYLLNHIGVVHTTGANDGSILSVQQGGDEVFKAASWGIMVPQGKYLEFNRGVSGKEINAGKIGYELFDTGRLNIVGAGTGTFAVRRVKIYDNLEVFDDLLVGGDLQVDGEFVGNNSGWLRQSDTWTRTGNHTFTISGDVTARYRKGTKVRYQDGGGVEYGTIVSSSHAAGTTTVNLLANTDYTMAAATITDKYLSYIENPEGFPEEFNFAVSWNNLTVGSGTTTATYYMRGNGEIFGHIGFTWGAGSSIGGGAAGVFVDLPAPRASYAREEQIGFVKCLDSSAGTTVAGATQYAGSDNFYPLYYVASTTPATIAAITATAPFTWATSDQLVFNFQYLT